MNNGYAKARPVIAPDGTRFKGVRAAARALSVDPATLSRWIKAGRDGWKYADHEPPKPKGRKPRVSPPPLTADECVGILELLPEIRDWLAGKIIHAEKAMLNRLQAGEQVVGYRAVKREGRDSWSNVAAAIDFFRSIGLPEECYVNKSLKPPSEVARLMTNWVGANVEYRNLYVLLGEPEIPDHLICNPETIVLEKGVE